MTTHRSPSRFTSLARRRPVTGFFILAYVISWTLWLPLLYGHWGLGWTTWEGNPWQSVRPYLGMLGALGPALAAVIMTAVLDGRTGMRRLGQRLLQWRTSKWSWLAGLYAWWLLCTLIAPSLGLLTASDAAVGLAFALINIPVLIVILQAPMLIGICGEEIGWRGFALPRLLPRFGPLGASLLVAVPWIFWHAPLAVFPEWRGNLPITDFLLNYTLVVIPLTIIFTWFFQHTGGSILLAIVLHRSFNLTFNAYPAALQLDESAGETLWQAAIVALWIIATLLTATHHLRHRRTPGDKAGDSSPRNAQLPH